MKKILKSALSILLVIALMSSFCVCFAAELNNEAVNKHYGQFKKYVLLGDSIASGYHEAVSQEEIDWNWVRNDTAFVRAEGSYSDIIANSIIEDKSLTPFAAPAFRTFEIRYMLEDDYEADRYLFNHPFTLKEMGTHEDYIDEYREAVATADLITLGVGGNDWGQFLAWVIIDITASFEGKNEYVAQMKEIVKDNIVDLTTVEKLVDILDTAELLPYFIQYLPQALNYGLENFYKNWDIMIQDIYDYNPDVTLMVVGMSDTGYSSEPKEETATDQAMHMISEAILSVGNKPMIDGAEKFGYTYVDITGATYIGGHPDPNGHIFIANKIIEALPDPDIHNKYSDVTTGHKYYSDIETVLLNGIMTPITETTFEPDSDLTKSQLGYALNKIDGVDNIISGDDAVTRLDMASSLIKASRAGDSSFMSKINSFTLAIKILMNGGIFKMNTAITRGEAAAILCDYMAL